MDNVEDYYSEVVNAITNNNVDTAILNLRYAIEMMANNYVTKYLPDAVYDSTFEKINRIAAIHIISDSSVNIFHSLRKLANKNVHIEGENVDLSEIKQAVAPLRRIIDEYNLIMKDEKNSFVSYNDSLKVSAEY